MGEKMLAQKYLQTPQRKAVDVLVLAHFDSHGVSYASARLRVLRSKGLQAEAYSKFPETGPQGFAQFIPQLLQQKTASVFEIIDIPINVQNPDAHIQALRRLAQEGKVVMYDHHETDVPFLPRLREVIDVVLVPDNFTMAVALELLSDQTAKELAIVGTVADRDAEGAEKFGIVENPEELSRYIDLANRLDTLVRSPQQFGYDSLVDVIEALAEQGTNVIPNITPPFYQYVEQVRLISENNVAILADFESVPPMWVPKVAERLLQLWGRDYVVIVVPALDPRTRQKIGYDVRVLQYWLSKSPEAEKVIRPFIEQAQLGQVVGHAKYVSIRLVGASKDEALKLARQVYERISGQRSMVTTLINDQIVANAVQRDFSTILQRLTEILEEQRKMYEQYLKLKEEQVRLLRETQDHRYD